MDLAFLKEIEGDSRISAESIKSAVEKAVRERVLKPGDKMPSTRDIAIYLGVSRTTVVSAFDTLGALGYLNTSRGAGTWIRDPEEVDSTAAHTVEKNPSLSSSASFLWERRRNSLAERILARAGRRPDSSELDQSNFGAPSKRLLPVRQWRQITTNISRNMEKTGFEDNRDVFGYFPLREAVAGYLRRNKGIVCSADQIVLNSGVERVFSPVFSLLVRAGDRVVVENPGFYGAREQFHSLGAEVLSVPVDEEGIIVSALDQLEDLPQWIYLAPSCQEPTGVILSQDRRIELLEWAHRNECAIIEDDWDSDFHYSSQSARTIFSQDPTGSVIYFYSFWRLLYPLCFTGVLVIPESLIDLFKGYMGMFDRQFTLMEHYVLTEMIEEGHVEKYIRKTWKYFKRCRQVLIYALKTGFKDRVEIVGSSTGLHVLARFDSEIDSEKLEKAALRAEFPMVCTDLFYVDEAPKNEYLIRFAEMELERVDGMVKEFVDSVLYD